MQGTEPVIYLSDRFQTVNTEERTNEAPSRRYAFLNPFISVSFLMDSMFSMYDGATVYRKCVSIKEIAYEV